MKYKVNYIDLNLLKNKRNKKTYIRSSTIIPELVNTTILVHNGQEFKKLKIKNEYLQNKIVDYIFTRKKNIFKKKDKK